MTRESMNIHKALAELKVLDDRIAKAMDAEKFVVANKHSNEKIGGVKIQTYMDRVKADYQKVRDLIERENALKRAVVLSNAKTYVTVNGVQYTVAEAIYMKNHGMEHLKDILRKMRMEYSSAENTLTTNSGENLERRAENYIVSVIQAQPKDSKMCADSEAMKALRKTYMENNSYDLIDPINVLDEIEALENFISGFETEVDAALSVSNAVTNIEIEY